MNGTGKRLNQRADRCADCGQWLEPGQGYLVHYDQDYLDDMDIFDLRPGWYVYCFDRTACKARQAENRRRREEAAQEKARRAQERAELIKQKEAEGWKHTVCEIFGADWAEDGTAEPGGYMRFIDDERCIKRPEEAGDYDVRAVKLLRVQDPEKPKSWLYFIR